MSRVVWIAGLLDCCIAGCCIEADCCRDVRAIPLISASRWLVRRGECTRLSWKEGEKMTFGRRVTKHQLTLFLLTDLLLVTKKKGEERFLVLDYTPRNMVQVGQHNTQLC